MKTNAKLAKGLQGQEVRDLVVRNVVKLGSVCAPDLAGHIGSGLRADELIPVLESLVGDGVLRHKKDPRDPRDYKEPYQVVYELVR